MIIIFLHRGQSGITFAIITLLDNLFHLMQEECIGFCITLFYLSGKNPIILMLKSDIR